MQEILERNGGENRGGKQRDDARRAGLQARAVLAFAGFFSGNRKLHEQGGDREIDGGRDKEREEIPELQLALLPDHQGCDVAKRAKRAARVRRDNDVDAGKRHEFRRVLAYCQDDGAHDERGGQIVENAGQEERGDAGNPKQLLVGQTPRCEPCPQNIEHASLFKRVHIGDRHKQKQEQLGEFLNDSLRQPMRLVRPSGKDVGDADQEPDQPRRHHDGLGLAQTQRFLEHDQRVGRDEDDQSQQTGPIGGKVQRGSRSLRLRRNSDCHRGGKKRKANGMAQAGRYFFKHEGLGQMNTIRQDRPRMDCRFKGETQ